jgi:hypothetical protein
MTWARNRRAALGAREEQTACTIGAAHGARLVEINQRGDNA